MYLESPQRVFILHTEPCFSHYCQGNNKGDGNGVRSPGLDVGGGVAPVRLAVGEPVAPTLNEVVLGCAASGVRIEVVYSY